MFDRSSRRELARRRMRDELEELLDVVRRRPVEPADEDVREQFGRQHVAGLQAPEQVIDLGIIFVVREPEVDETRRIGRGECCGNRRPHLAT